MKYSCSIAKIPGTVRSGSREYHPDYLGSVEAVTNGDGMVYQFFHNTIWRTKRLKISQWLILAPGPACRVGKQQHKAYLYNSFSSRYRFNAKERDWETGNFYYGARYFDPKISVWLSVDPLSSERSWITPYNFIQNDVLSRVDPDGNLDVCETCPKNDSQWDIFRESEFEFEYNESDKTVERVSKDKINLEEVKNPLLEVNVFMSEVNRGKYKGDLISDHFVSNEEGYGFSNRQEINYKTKDGVVKINIELGEKKFGITIKFSTVSKNYKNVKNPKYKWRNAIYMDSIRSGKQKVSGSGADSFPLITITLPSSKRGREMLINFANNL